MKFLRTLSILLMLYAPNALANYEDQTFSYLDKKKWGEAINAATKSGDKLLVKIAKARKFVLADPSENNFEEITSFISQNPEWPQILMIKIAAENAITPSTDRTKVVSWFDHNEPQTDIGAKYYALAAAKTVKDRGKLQRIIRDGWVYGDFTPHEQSAFLKQNGKLLTADDHAKKIDYIIWHRDPRKIDGLLSLVSSHDKEMFKAAIAFRTGKSNSESLFSKLKPKEKHHSIVLYSYLQLHIKDEVIDDRLAKLIINAPIDHDHAKEWWKLKGLFARNRLKFKHYASAYEIAKNHNSWDAEDVSEAEFLAGWLALRYLNKTDVAHQHFHNMLRVVKQPISLAKSSYWLGRSSKDKKEAHKRYREAAAFNYTFYGQLAELELGNKTLTLPPRPKVQESHRKNYRQNDLARATNILLKHKKDEVALLYGKAAVAQASSPEEAMLIIESFNGLKKPAFTIGIAKAASCRGLFIAHAAFPTPHKITNGFVEPALAYSIMRQETMFSQHAISEKDARGLMQLIPKTACATAKSLKIKCELGKLLTHPEYNIKLGCRELRNRLDKYNGSYILTFAAYNAGPNPTNSWVEFYGDPRQFKDKYKVIDWIESIPYHETRNYVQRIMENLQVYRALLGKGSEIRLLKDLGAR